MGTRAHDTAGNGETREQVERLVELLSAYTGVVLTGRPLEQATHGELTAAQYDALAFIHRHGGCSAKALAEGLRISFPSSTRLVDRLERKQLVARRESGEYRRLVKLTIAENGVAFLRAVHEARVNLLAGALGTLQPDERSELLQLLERFMLAALCDEQTVADCCLHCGTDHDRACVVNEAHIALVGRPIAHP